MKAKKYLIHLIVPLILITIIESPIPVYSQQLWDLSIEKVTVLPLNGEVQQGQPLTITIYLRNKEPKVFSGVVKVSAYVDGELALVEYWEIGNVSAGSIPIPAGGYTTITTKLNTSNLTIGIHDLKVKAEPKYGDPNPEDNAYGMKFSVIPLVEAFIDVKREMVQGKEYFVKVHVPNPSSDALDLKVRLFVNDSEVGAKSIYVPPKSISLAEFPLKPKYPGTLELTALVTRGDRPYSKASAKISVSPSCDLQIAELLMPRKVQRGDVLTGKIRVLNEGPAPTRVNLSLYVDDKLVDSQISDSIASKEEAALGVEIPTFNLSVGNHTLIASLSSLDAIDLDLANNDYTITFQVKPLPVSLSVSSLSGSIEANITNSGGILGTFDVILMRGGEEMDRSSVTLEPGSSQVIVFKELTPGNYTVEVMSYGVEVSSARVKVIGHQEVEGGASLYWWLVAGIVAALGLYLAFRGLKRKKWPSS